MDTKSKSDLRAAQSLATDDVEQRKAGLKGGGEVQRCWAQAGGKDPTASAKVGARAGLEERVTAPPRTVSQPLT